METHIVAVENVVHHSEERRTSAFAREVNAYLERYPLTEYVDVMLTDLNGSFRGKRIPVTGLLKIEKGCYFPASVFAMDILGNVVEEAGLGQDLGEPDRRCVPVAGSLVPSATDPEYLGQLLLTMQDEDGTPFDVEPRNVLNRLWQQLRQRGLRPVVAVELEFYLIDRQRDAEGYLQPPCAPGTQDRNTQSQVYSVDNLDRFADVLSDIDELARMQQIPADGAVAEASPGQFEINLHHTDNVLQACDHALALKRLVRLVAEKHGMQATFMAKPYEEHAGSGMHIHISIVDDNGQNVLALPDGDDSCLLKQALAGMIDMMPASMALLAPNVNSYRRFQPGMYVPTQASWGHNNRTVALRIPCGDRDSHRVEYRVAGADANPYLVMSAVLAGIVHGLENDLPLPEAVEGNGLEQEGTPFPIRQSDALYEFQVHPAMRERLGARFCEVFHACKNDELIQFERLITETEIEWMLKNA
ncbi:glutamine synthetase family protein [Cronobacter turicensis]|jgi:gamma-glutamylputrescine synthase|uniref:glutamine synthetase family protein n=1 Tax=Cronobacter turicensis TaxID=413502 RepID=UPI001375AAC1|nr:glutamine synthetase family protein [Cronobacter turicensis]EGT5680603.1 glutamine synthetase [Cronobacter turicensis]EGT5738800.1 glutamine synthetase [Cronobacter turicensis]EKM0376987.1 glutamine synthetase [Cronobacter turicensis]EKM5064071.1 glutamine synthetase [Cronobacter turicensis]EKY3196014.1 glutamine synthetase [Cronobacter turicensis]